VPALMALMAEEKLRNRTPKESPEGSTGAMWLAAVGEFGLRWRKAVSLLAAVLVVGGGGFFLMRRGRGGGAT